MVWRLGLASKQLVVKCLIPGIAHVGNGGHVYPAHFNLDISTWFPIQMGLIPEISRGGKGKVVSGSWGFDPHGSRSSPEQRTKKMFRLKYLFCFLFSTKGLFRSECVGATLGGRWWKSDGRAASPTCVTIKTIPFQEVSSGKSPFSSLDRLTSSGRRDKIRIPDYQTNLALEICLYLNTTRHGNWLTPARLPT